MIRILVICTVEFGNNGISSVIMNYYRAMEKKDIQMDFLAGAGVSGEIKDELKAAGSTVYEIPRKRNTVEYIKKLSALLMKKKYQIVHVHGNSATMAFELIPAVKAQVPVRIAHSHSSSCKNQMLHKILYRKFEKSYTKGFACGEKAGKWLFQSNPYTIIRNGIDTWKFCFSSDMRYEYRRKIGAGNRKVIGHVGYFDSVKNQDFIIELAARLKNEDTKYLFLFIGEGKTMYRIREKADAYKVLDSILFCGTVNDVYGYMAAMDIFMLPSLYEGLPVSLLEAQCSGLPCLASDRVPPEADVTGLVEFLPLEKPELWMKKLREKSGCENRNETSYRAAADIKAKGYDITENAETLKKLYISYTEA